MTLWLRPGGGAGENDDMLRQLEQLILEVIAYSGSGRLSLAKQEVAEKSPQRDVGSDLDWLVVENLLNLGALSHELNCLVMSTKSFELPALASEHTMPEPPRGASPYHKALMSAVHSSLEDFRMGLLDALETHQQDYAMAVDDLAERVEEFLLWLPQLHCCIKEILAKRMTGGELLLYLQSKSERCNPSLAEKLRECFIRCLHAFLDQLEAWMIYGNLPVYSNEFFVDRLARKDMAEDWNAYVIHKEKVPPFISSETAESILFVGKAVNLLRNPSRKPQMTEPGIRRWSNGTNATHDSSSQRSYFGSLSSAEELTGLSFDSGAAARSMNESLEESMRRIQVLLQTLRQSTTFEMVRMDETIEAARKIVAHDLWQFLILNSDLHGHLNVLHKFALLAHGDFYQTFLELAKPNMRLPFDSSTSYTQLLKLIDQTSAKTLSDEDRLSFQLVSFSFTDLPSRTQSMADSKTSMPVHASLTSLAQSNVPGGLESSRRLASEATSSNCQGWDTIQIKFDVQWPLHLVFNKKALTRYNEIFQHLLSLKQAILELQAARSILTQLNRSRARVGGNRGEEHLERSDGVREDCACWNGYWILLQQMRHFVQNLFSYAMVDVITVQFQRLEERIRSTQGFDELISVHEQFLMSVKGQLLLDIAGMNRIIREVILQCRKFCELLTEIHVSNRYSKDEALAILKTISDAFEVKSRALFTKLGGASNLKAEQIPNLRRVLMHMNMNNFYSYSIRV